MLHIGNDRDYQHQYFYILKCIPLILSVQPIRNLTAIMMTTPMRYGTECCTRPQWESSIVNAIQPFGRRCQLASSVQSIYPRSRKNKLHQNQKLCLFMDQRYNYKMKQFKLSNSVQNFFLAFIIETQRLHVASC